MVMCGMSQVWWSGGDEEEDSVSPRGGLRHVHSADATDKPGVRSTW